MAFSRRLVAVLVGCALAFAAAQGSYSGTRSSLDLMDVDFMFVGAHPDDDGSIMTTFARYILDEGYQGTVVTLTGGEGGSNATGPELGRSLGLIRQEEERIALSLIGVDSPHWLGCRTSTSLSRPRRRSLSGVGTSSSATSCASCASAAQK